MIRNIVTTALRNIKNNKAISAINITGLAISLSCFLLIFMWVADQLSYDRFFKNSESIYRINTFVKGKGITVLSVENTAPALKNNYAEVINACRIFPSKLDIVIRYDDKDFFENGELCADSNFFELFKYEIVRGERKKLLDNSKNIVLTESIASKIFGSTDPIGKILTLNPGNRKRELVVSGIIKDPPGNTHLKLHFVTQLQNLPFWGNGWEYTDVVTYVQLSKNTDASVFEKKIGGLIKQYNSNTNYELQIQPLTDIHLYSSGYEDAERAGVTGEVSYIYIFTITALLVLILASINFINLSIAGHYKKIKEAGIKKIMGATQNHLVIQFLGESFLTVLIAMLAALLCVYSVLPFFNQLYGIELKLNLLDPKMITGLLGIVLFTGIISGCYPALILSSTKPLNLLKNMYTKEFKAATVRKILLIFQFSLSTGILIASIVCSSQLDYIMKKNLGFNKEQIIYFNGHSLPSDPKEELLKIAGVQKVCWSSELPISVNDRLTGIKWEGMTGEDVSFQYLKVDQDFIKTYDLKIKEGRNYSQDLRVDTNSYIINESAVKAMRLNMPVGKQLTCYTGLGSPVPGLIIGVVKDFHLNSLHKKIEPLIMGIKRGKPWYVSVKINAANIGSTIDRIGQVFKTLYPDHVFNYQFLDKTFEKQYIQEKRMSSVFGYFSIFIVIISCLGLFGLVSIVAEQNRKEIGIRKVLGASVTDVVILFTKNYLAWICIAAVIAAPAAYLLMNKWLESFAYRIDIQLWMFILSAGITGVSALLSICYKVIKAALVNPVESIRYD